MKLVPGCMERWVGGVLKGFTGNAGDEWENLPQRCVGDLLSNVKMAFGATRTPIHQSVYLASRPQPMARPEPKGSLCSLHGRGLARLNSWLVQITGALLRYT